MCFYWVMESCHSISTSISSTDTNYLMLCRPFPVSSYKNFWSGFEEYFKISNFTLNPVPFPLLIPLCQVIGSAKEDLGLQAMITFTFSCFEGSKIMIPSDLFSVRVLILSERAVWFIKMLVLNLILIWLPGHNLLGIHDSWFRDFVVSWLKLTKTQFCLIWLICCSS